MPSSSRKRNKGKDRKAKQLAKKEENIRAEAHEYWRSFCGINQCDHGRPLMISDDHPVSSFMDHFYINLRNKGLVVSAILREIFATHRNIWNNESYMKIVLDLFVRIGTNMMLHEDVDTKMNGPVCVAQAIIALEHYDGRDDIDSVGNKRIVSSKWRDLGINSSEKRDALKFFRKRTSCKCLKKVHLEARETLPKLGHCYNCQKEMERVHLSVCSRCNICHYCSRECQVAQWPEHREDCDVYVEANRN